MVGRLHRQLPARRRPAVACAGARYRRLAQGRQLLPPLPRQSRAGTAYGAAVVGSGAARRRHVHRARLGRRDRPLPGGAPGRRLARRVRRPDPRMPRVRGVDRATGYPGDPAPVHAARLLQQPRGAAALHVQSADGPARAIQPAARRRRRLFAPGARHPASAGAAALRLPPRCTTSSLGRQRRRCGCRSGSTGYGQRADPSRAPASRRSLERRRGCAIQPASRRTPTRRAIR